MTSDDPLVEIGQLPDDRQFVAAVQRLDRGWIAVVHFFSADGDHVDTEHSALVDGGDEAPRAARDELEVMLRRLEPYRAEAATVAGFTTEVAGQQIGLSAEAGGGGMRLLPAGPTLAQVDLS